MTMRSFDLSDEDYALLIEFGYANRLNRVNALRHLLRTHCAPNNSPDSVTITLDDDNRQQIDRIIARMGGKNTSVAATSATINALIRRALRPR